MSVKRIISEYHDYESELHTWKVFKVYAGQLYFPHWTLKGEYLPGIGVAPTDCWLTAKSVKAPTLLGEKYQTGFHVCKTELDAKMWSTFQENRIILPVLVKGVRLEFSHSPENQHNMEDIVSGYIADYLYLPQKHLAFLPSL
jgi:hypothetical protein